MFKWGARVVFRGQIQTFKHFPAFVEKLPKYFSKFSQHLWGFVCEWNFLRFKEIAIDKSLLLPPAKKANEKLYAEENLVYL